MKVNMDAVKVGRGVVERAACRRLRVLAGRVPVREAIVELGAYCGRSTGWLVAGSKGAHVWSVDPWETLDTDAVSERYAAVEPKYRNGDYLTAGDVWRAHMVKCQVTPRMVTAVRSTALEAAERWSGPLVGLLFHDAQHTAEAVAADLEAWLPHMAERATVALHDIGQKAYGVEDGAGPVLTAAGFDWANRERLLWKKDPTRRGLAVVRR